MIFVSILKNRKQCSYLLFKIDNLQEDCLNTDTLVPIDYFHRPLKSIPESNPLSDLTISISMYVGSERTFLADVASFLGAT